MRHAACVIDLLERAAGVLDERVEAHGSRLAKIVGQALLTAAERLLERLQDAVLGHVIELQHASGRQRGEVGLHLLGQPAARDAGDGGQHLVEAELAPVLAHEIEDEAARLVQTEPQPAAHLLEEDCRAGGGPQKEQRVHKGKVDPLVEQVAGEEDVHLPIAEARRGGGPVRCGSVSVDDHGGDSIAVESVGHELRVSDAGAER